MNVGGHVVKMDKVRTLFGKLGFANVETFLASGNVIFESRLKSRTAAERSIEQALHEALGYESVTFIRTMTEVTAIARHRPFSASALASAAALNVGLLKEPLSDAARLTLSGLRTDIDDFHANASELYWICALKQSDSKISNAVLEKALQVKTTLRGRRTMEKIAAKYAAA
jgi:uncharacterized protein (DUF1697 family)